jgi:hypothetical protein
MRPRNVLIGGVTALAVMLMVGIAMAQSPNPLPPTAVRPDAKCAPVQPSIGPEGRVAPKTAPHARSTDGQAPPLSDQLAQGDGVLCPPKNVDPDIVAPTPDVGTMPVVPPPGSPGGDPTIQPK